MSAIDQTFNESVLRLQGWLQFLNQKEAEFMTQMSRVRRGAPAPDPAQASEETAGWE